MSARPALLANHERFRRWPIQRRGRRRGHARGERGSLPREIQDAARRKLKVIDAAPDLGALRVPPGNRLEALKGDRKGQWSIRINSQWRICFRWKDRVALDVEIVDYH
jgi:proteic killer suppression protein